MNPNLRLAAAAVFATLPFAVSAEPPARSPDTLPIYDTVSIGSLAIEAASKAAINSGRRLLVNFGSNDCAPCGVVNDAIYEEPFLTAFLGEFVPVFVNAGPDSQNEELLARYGVDPSKGLPAIVLSDAEMRVAEVTKEGEVAAAGAKGKEAVQEWLLKRFSRK